MGFKMVSTKVHSFTSITEYTLIWLWTMNTLTMAFNFANESPVTWFGQRANLERVMSMFHLGDYDCWYVINIILL